MWCVVSEDCIDNAFVLEESLRNFMTETASLRSKTQSVMLGSPFLCITTQ